MKIVHISTETWVDETEEELKEEHNSKQDNLFLINPRKRVPLKEPIYIVEMTSEELQVVSFYLELEKRKPIVNVQVDAKLTGGN